MNKTLVILGSTSTGKTDLALRLAKKFNGQLVSCDSRQVYQELDIGTGKAPSGIYNEQFTMHKKEKCWEVNGVKIWMYDVVSPQKQYTVYDYIQDANTIINEILKKGGLPVIVGGTGLYLKALLKGLPNLETPIDPKLRQELEKLSLQQLQTKLQKLSPHKWKGMNNSDRQNPRRLVRAIEIATSVDINITTVGLMSIKSKSKTEGDVLKIGLTAPREILYQRIDERVVIRINQGMIEEAEKLHKAGLNFKRMRQLGLEYGILADYLEGKIKNKEELIKVMQGKIHGYARRQLTWFKKEQNVFWFDTTKNNWLSEVESKVNSWYYLSYDKKN